MNKKTKIAIAALALTGLSFGVTAGGCSNDADVASKNLSTDSDNFKIPRRITVINGITDKYLMAVEGYCSITADTADSQLEITCKEQGGYTKDIVGIPDNVTYLVEQEDPAVVSVKHRKIIFKPEEIVPGVELR